MSDLVHIGWIREDRAHDVLVKTLAAKVALERHDWLDGVLEHTWSWKGPNHEDEAKLTGRIEVTGPGGKPARVHGRIAGEPLMPEASMVRTVLVAFERRQPRPELVILARDGDGYAAQRRRGVDQVRTKLQWSFPVVLAMPEPEGEAWFIAGFEPRNDEERARLDALVQELAFDPTKQPHRTTAHPNDASTDTKRVLARLTRDDALRRDACLDHPLDELARRGATTGLAQFIAELREHLPARFAARG